uniref:NADH-ubiquinone oxidoreductase chain 6 n=1 Tax=Oedemera virescens TaxID=433056 RepID=E3VTJ4_9CUCU|nr:NADH dehydrogenase subunit 6 [Oedemera virescens]
MIMLMSINLTLSMIFIMLTHPLSMGLILLIQTIIISMMTGNMTPNFWFSYILFLILIGGMLILFIYMTSIASNEKFKMNSLMTMMILLPLIVILSSNFIYFNPLTYITNEKMNLFNSLNLISTSIMKYLNMPSSYILMFMIIYLLLTLIVTVKITNFSKGPLRQMN